MGGGSRTLCVTHIEKGKNFHSIFRAWTRIKTKLFVIVCERAWAKLSIPKNIFLISQLVCCKLKLK
jgi:hypothetical protein